MFTRGGGNNFSSSVRNTGGGFQGMGNRNTGGNRFSSGNNSSFGQRQQGHMPSSAGIRVDSRSKDFTLKSNSVTYTIQNVAKDSRIQDFSVEQIRTGDYQNGNTGFRGNNSSFGRSGGFGNQQRSGMFGNNQQGGSQFGNRTFGNQTSSGSRFGNQGGGMGNRFGQNQQQGQQGQQRFGGGMMQRSQGNSMFGNRGGGNFSQQSSRFGNNNTSNSSSFGGNRFGTSSSGSRFGSGNTSQGGGSMFNRTTQGGSMFGNRNQQGNTSAFGRTTQGNSTFGNRQGNSPFGNNNRTQQGNSPFGNRGGMGNSPFNKNAGSSSSSPFGRNNNNTMGNQGNSPFGNRSSMQSQQVVMQQRPAEPMYLVLPPTPSVEKKPPAVQTAAPRHISSAPYGNQTIFSGLSAKSIPSKAPKNQAGLSAKKDGQSSSSSSTATASTTASSMSSSSSSSLGLSSGSSQDRLHQTLGFQSTQRRQLTNRLPTNSSIFADYETETKKVPDLIPSPAIVRVRSRIGTPKVASPSKFNNPLLDAAFSASMSQSKIDLNQTSSSFAEKSLLSPSAPMGSKGGATDDHATGDHPFGSDHYGVSSPVIARTPTASSRVAKPAPLNLNTPRGFQPSSPAPPTNPLFDSVQGSSNHATPTSAATLSPPTTASSPMSPAPPRAKSSSTTTTIQPDASLDTRDDDAPAEVNGSIDDADALVDPRAYSVPKDCVVRFRVPGKGVVECAGPADFAGFSVRELSKVEALTITHKVHGRVQWENPIDISMGYSFRDCVVFEPKSLEVYPDDFNYHPEEGQELNSPAVVTLFNVFKTDSNGNAVTSPEAKKKYANRVVKRTVASGAELLEFNADKGIWHFRVAHFSRYGMDDDDDDDDDDDTENARATSVQGKLRKAGALKKQPSNPLLPKTPSRLNRVTTVPSAKAKTTTTTTTVGAPHSNPLTRTNKFSLDEDSDDDGGSSSRSGRSSGVSHHDVNETFTVDDETTSPEEAEAAHAPYGIRRTSLSPNSKQNDNPLLQAMKVAVFKSNEPGFDNPLLPSRESYVGSYGFRSEVPSDAAFFTRASDGEHHPEPEAAAPFVSPFARASSQNSSFTRSEATAQLAPNTSASKLMLMPSAYDGAAAVRQPQSISFLNTSKARAVSVPCHESLLYRISRQGHANPSIKDITMKVGRTNRVSFMAGGRFFLPGLRVEAVPESTTAHAAKGTSTRASGNNRLQAWNRSAEKGKAPVSSARMLSFVDKDVVGSRSVSEAHAQGFQATMNRIVDLVFEHSTLEPSSRPTDNPSSDAVAAGSNWAPFIHITSNESGSDVAKSICICKHTATLLKEQLASTTYPASVAKSLHYYSEVMMLVDALWGPPHLYGKRATVAEIDTYLTNVRNASFENQQMYGRYGAAAQEAARRRAILEWFRDVEKGEGSWTTTLSTNSGGRHDEEGENEYLKELLVLLLQPNIHAAIELALGKKDYRLAMLMTQVEKDDVARTLVRDQLIDWTDRDALRVINPLRVRVYALLAGHASWPEQPNSYNRRRVHSCEGLNWRRALCAHIQYLSPKSAVAAIDTYQVNTHSWLVDASGARRLAFPPVVAHAREHVVETDSTMRSCQRVSTLNPQHPPSDAHSRGQPETFPTDLQFELFSVFAGGHMKVEHALNPLSHTSNAYDYQLSWLLFVVLRGIHVVRAFDGEGQLHTAFADQLQQYGCQRASLLVLQHMSDDAMRTHLVRDSVRRSPIHTEDALLVAMSSSSSQPAPPVPSASRSKLATNVVLSRLCAIENATFPLEWLYQSRFWFENTVDSAQRNPPLLVHLAVKGGLVEDARRILLGEIFTPFVLDSRLSQLRELVDLVTAGFTTHGEASTHTGSAASLAHNTSMRTRTAMTTSLAPLHCMRKYIDLVGAGKETSRAADVEDVLAAVQRLPVRSDRDRWRNELMTANLVALAKTATELIDVHDDDDQQQAVAAEGEDGTHGLRDNDEEEGGRARFTAKLVASAPCLTSALRLSLTPQFHSLVL